jgi:hypothetical protein
MLNNINFSHVLTLYYSNLKKINLYQTTIKGTKTINVANSFRTVFTSLQQNKKLLHVKTSDCHIVL